MKSKLSVPTGRVNKNIDEYIRRAYQLNKGVVQEAVREFNEGPNLFGTFIDPYEFFSEEVKARIDSRTSVQDAIKEFGRTEAFITKAERRLYNAQQGITSEREAYNAFRRVWGWQKKIDWTQLKRTEDPNVYVMGHVLIDFRNSPVRIIFIDLRTNAQTTYFKQNNME